MPLLINVLGFNNCFLCFFSSFIINNNNKTVAIPPKKRYLCRQFVIYCGCKALQRGRAAFF